MIASVAALAETVAAVLRAAITPYPESFRLQQVQQRPKTRNPFARSWRTAPAYTPRFRGSKKLTQPLQVTCLSLQALNKLLKVADNLPNAGLRGFAYRNNLNFVGAGFRACWSNAKEGALDVNAGLPHLVRQVRRSQAQSSEPA